MSSEKRGGALTKPSDLSGPVAATTNAEAGPADAGQPVHGRALPPVMRIGFAPGQLIELRDDQVFADRVVIRRGERGKVLYPSSQAAAWVVLFPRVGAKLRVIPEHLLATTE